MCFFRTRQPTKHQNNVTVSQINSTVTIISDKFNLSNHMKNLIGLVALLCASLALNASPFTEQQKLTLAHDIKMLEDHAKDVNELQFSDQYLQNLRNKHRKLTHFFANEEISQAEKDGLQDLFQSLNQILPLHLKSVKPLDFTALANHRGNSNGVITGRILEAQSQQPQENVSVYLYNSFGSYIRYTKTDNLGRYAFTDLNASSYFISSGGNNLYVRQFNDNIICPGGIGQGCSLADLTPIDVSENGIVDHIDILMQQSGRISGRLYFDDTSGDSGQAEIYDQNGILIDSQYLNNNGTAYQFYIPPNYSQNLYLKFTASNHFSSLYDNVPCNSTCSVTNGTPVNVSAYQTVNLNDTELQAFTEISGTIDLNELVSLPQSSTNIIITDTNHSIISSQNSYYHTGVWQSPPMETGQYYVYVNKEYYVPQFYDYKNCDGQSFNDCPNLIPNIVTHDREIESEQINFTLDQYGTISGQVMDSQDNLLRPDRVMVFDMSGQLITNNFILDNYTYTLMGIPDGDYYVTASDYGFITGVYPDYICQNSPQTGYCSDSVPATSIITISQQNHHINKHITLSRGASIFGQILDENLESIQGKNIVLMDDEFNILREQNTNQSGFYLNNITPGDYYLAARENEAYKAGMYDGIQCEELSSCPNNQATSINISDSSEYGPYTITVQSKPQLSVTLNAIKPGTTVDSGEVVLYNAQGQPVIEKHVSSSQVTFYPEPGQYHVYYDALNQYYSSERFINKPFGGTSCQTNCNPINGSLITVTNQSSQQINMDIDAAFKIKGQVSLPGNDLYYANIHVKAYRNDLLTENQTFHNTYQYFFEGSEDIKIAAEYPHFYTHVYENIHCQGEGCGLNQATIINPVFNNELTIDFILQPQNSITGRVFNSSNQPMTGFAVSLISEQGHSRTTNTDNNGFYSFNGLDSGNYNLFTQSQNIFLATRNTGETCEYLCPFDTNASIELGLIGHISDVNISPLEKGGIVVSDLRLMDNSIAQNAQITVYDRDTGSSVNIAGTDAEGNTEKMHLTPGDYYLIAKPSSHYHSPKTAYPNYNCRELTENVCIELSTTVTITGTETVTLNDFIIHDEGQLSITIKDSNSQNLIPESRTITIYDSNLGQIAQQSTQNGVIDELSLPAGAYYIMAKPNSYSEYSAKLYPNIHCPKGIGIDCVITQGQTFTINDNQSIHLDFLLDKKPSITIQAYDSYTENWIQSQVKVYKSTGTIYIETANQNVHTLYLDEDSYYILVKPASNRSAYYNSKLYPDVVCTDYNIWDGCNYLSADMVSINSLNNPPLTVGLDLVNGFIGYVVNAQTNAPIENVTIDVWRNLGSSPRHEYATYTNEDGKFSVPRNGMYYFSTHLPENITYFNEVYNNHICFDGSPYWGLCDITEGDLVDNYSPNTVKEIFFTIGGDVIFSDSFELVSP